MLAVSTVVLKTLWLWLTFLHLEVRFLYKFLYQDKKKKK